MKSLDFLFATVDGGGNVAPAMTVVRALIKRGHRCGFSVMPRAKAR